MCKGKNEVGRSDTRHGDFPSRSVTPVALKSGQPGGEALRKFGGDSVTETARNVAAYPFMSKASTGIPTGVMHTRV